MEIIPCDYPELHDEIQSEFDTRSFTCFACKIYFTEIPIDLNILFMIYVR